MVSLQLLPRQHLFLIILCGVLIHHKRDLSFLLAPLELLLPPVFALNWDVVRLAILAHDFGSDRAESLNERHANVLALFTDLGA